MTGARPVTWATLTVLHSPRPAHRSRTAAHRPDPRPNAPGERSINGSAIAVRSIASLAIPLSSSRQTCAPTLAARSIVSLAIALSSSRQTCAPTLAVHSIASLAIALSSIPENPPQPSVADPPRYPSGPPLRLIGPAHHGPISVHTISSPPAITTIRAFVPSVDRRSRAWAT